MFVMENNSDSLNQQSIVSPPPHRFSKTFIVLIAVILLVAAGVGGYILGTNQNQTVQTQPVTQLPQPSPTPDPTANWKTYSNTKYDFSFKYPSEWEIDDSSSNDDVNTSDRFRFYNLSDMMEIKMHDKNCQDEFNRGINPCTIKYPEIRQVYVYVVKNTNNLSMEELIKNQKLSDISRETIGNLNVIKGIPGIAGGRTSYYFIDPTQSFMLIIELADEWNQEENKRTPESIIRQILSTFRFN